MASMIYFGNSKPGFFSLVILLWSVAAGAGEINGKIIRYGTYTQTTPNALVPNEDSSSGQFNRAPWEFVDETTRVPARIGVRFGFDYELNGLPKHQPVELTLIVKHPPMRNHRGVTSTGYSRSLRFRSSTGNVHGTHGYGFDEPYELQRGAWSIEFHHHGNLLFGRTFEVY